MVPYDEYAAAIYFVLSVKLVEMLFFSSADKISDIAWCCSVVVHSYVRSASKEWCPVRSLIIFSGTPA